MEALSFASCIAFVLISKSFAIDETIRSKKFDYEEERDIGMLMAAALQPTPKIAFSSYNPTRMDYGEGDVIKFENVLFNYGKGYDIVSGGFTAPVAGLYHFIVHVCNRPPGAAVVAITHNGVVTAIGTQHVDTFSTCGSVNSIINVEVGDKVYVKSPYKYTQMYEDSYRRLSFMGFLLHE